MSTEEPIIPADLTILTDEQLAYGLDESRKRVRVLADAVDRSYSQLVNEDDYSEALRAEQDRRIEVAKPVLVFTVWQHDQEFVVHLPNGREVLLNGAEIPGLKQLADLLEVTK